MSKQSKIIVALTMIMMVISMTTICFTFAWYDIFPKYHDITLSTGKDSLLIESNVFLRTRDAQGNAQLTKTDNYKTATIDGSGQIGPDPANKPTINTSTGVLEVNFTNLSFSIFGTVNDGNIILPGGSLDESNMSWNMNYLTFAVIEVRFYNQFFPAYLQSTYYSEAIVTPTSTSTPAEYDIDQLFTMTVLEDKVEKNRVDMLGLSVEPQAPVADKIKQVENNVVAPGSNARYLSSKNKDGAGLFMEGAAGQEVNRQEEIQPNANKTPEGNKCYSYAYAIGLSINPKEILNIMNTTGFNPATASASLTFSIEFIKQNTAGGGAQ